MDVAEFHRSITNGIGRPVLWLRENSWKPHAESIENVCRHNTAYDPQCEGSRAEYVHEVISLTDDPRHFAHIAVDALLSAKVDWDLHHLYHLVRLLAQHGHETARSALYEKFEATGAPFVGAGDLVRLDGEKGLMFVLDRIGGFIESHPDCWEDGQLLAEAAEVLGTDVEQTLRNVATSNANIRRYLQSVDLQQSRSLERQTPEYRRWTYSEMKEHIIREGAARLGWLRGWGRHASESELIEAATDVLRESEPRHLAAILGIFAVKPFPLDPRRLIELAASEWTEVSTAAQRALRHVQHPSVRTFAIDLLSAGGGDGDVVRLLANNYADGDDQFILAALDRSTTEDDFHWTANAALSVFETNPAADAMPSVLRIYEACRCSICRMGAVECLIVRKQTPEWMASECCHDSNAELRRLMNR